MNHDEMPVCPECGAETNDFYVDAFGSIIGCTECVKKIDAWERSEADRIGALMDKAVDAWKERQCGLD